MDDEMAVCIAAEACGYTLAKESEGYRLYQSDTRQPLISYSDTATPVTLARCMLIIADEWRKRCEETRRNIDDKRAENDCLYFENQTLYEDLFRLEEETLPFRKAKVLAKHRAGKVA